MKTIPFPFATEDLFCVRSTLYTFKTFIEHITFYEDPTYSVRLMCSRFVTKRELFWEVPTNNRIANDRKCDSGEKYLCWNQ